MYCEKVYERYGKNLFWSIKNSGEVLDELGISTPPVCLHNVNIMIFPLFTLLYLTIQLKINLLILLKEPSKEKVVLTLHASKQPKNDHTWSCQNVCNALPFLLDNIYIRLTLSSIDKL